MSVENNPQTEPIEPTVEQRRAAAERLDEAYANGDPEEIRAAHAFVRSLSAPALEHTVRITVLPKQVVPVRRLTSVGGLRRVSLTSGYVRGDHGTPRGLTR